MKGKENYKRLAERMDRLETEMKEIKSLLEETGQRPGDKYQRTAEERDSESSEGEIVPVVTPEEVQVRRKGEGKRDWETLIGQVWLPRVFIVVLLIGVVWAFQSAFENNWITEPVRVLIGFVSAAGLSILGVYQIHKRRRGLGISLIGGGAGIWVFSTFAGTVLYELIPSPLSFALYVTGIAAGLYLSHRYRSQTLAVLLTITGFFVPFLVGGEEGNFFIFFSYELVLLVSLGFYAWWRDYTFLLYAATLFPSVTFAIYGAATAISGSERSGIGPLAYEDIFALTVVGIHICLSWGVFATKIVSRPKGMLVSLTLGASLLWLTIASVLTSYSYDIGWLTFTASVFDALLIGGAIVYSRIAYRYRQEQGTLFHLAILFSVVLITVELFRIFDYEGYTLLVLVEAAVLYRLGFWVHSRFYTILASFFFTGGALRTLDEIQYMETVWGTPVWEGIVTAVAAYFVYRLFRFESAGELMREDVRRFGMYAFAAASLGFALLTLSHVAFFVGEEYAYEYRDVFVSVSWVTFALLTLVIGLLRDEKRLRIFSILWIFVTLAKAFLVDISYIDATVRGLLFIGLGIVGVLVSRFFYRSNKEESER
ncbi:DUF2339 domain-containing protein [Salimicrobium sp. PL1-032A]|uniref:DUF2339 domain-containing protein n=1 Tax=Salimicrobium sp. PL1-032A TaxID=3095364 RepID=UPI003260FE4A